MEKSILPKPDSEELKVLVKDGMTRAAYGVLFENRGKPLSMSEIRNLLGLASGEQEHLNRRVRTLYRAFVIERIRRGKDTVYRLVSVSEKPRQVTGRISKKVRAWVLRNQRCAQCGRNPSEDGVKLHVDHVVPQDWDGTDDVENLQALCSECNEGKKNLYSSYDKFKDKIRLAISHEEPHRRIGELLNAFGGEPVPAELIEVVAKAKQYQDDWQKRMRELRVLGWEYSYEKKKNDGRVRTFYRLKHFEPWPKGSIRAEITRREREKK